LDGESRGRQEEVVGYGLHDRRFGRGITGMIDEQYVVEAALSILERHISSLFIPSSNYMAT
jgi:hypothetical protein